MKNYHLLLISLFTIMASCNSGYQRPLVSMDKVYAWCIVPFDSIKRTPEDRIKMLKSLGISQYAYDWRTEHLATMGKELELARQNDVDINAVWLWIDDDWDAVGKLNESNEKVFEILKAVNYSGQLWVSFHANFYEGLSDAEAVKKGGDMIAYLSQRASTLNCKVALYNHGSWFGEPKNQIKIIKSLPNQELGIIYNFHHAHHQIEGFDQMASDMLPYLWAINLNGLRKEGPKIMTIGAGNHEAEMITLLLKLGYQGDFGVLGHVEDADVKEVLKANLAGLKKL